MKTLYKKIAASLPLLALFLFLGACGSTATLTGGYDDKATVLIAAKEFYIDEEVNLYVDGQLAASNVQVVRESRATRKAPRIEVAPGTHEVAVVDMQGKELHRAKIFLSTGKSKVIVLP